MSQFENFSAFLLHGSTAEFSRNVFLGTLTSSELVVGRMGTELQCGVPAHGFTNFLGCSKVLKWEIWIFHSRLPVMTHICIKSLWSTQHHERDTTKKEQRLITSVQLWLFNVTFISLFVFLYTWLWFWNTGVYFNIKFLFFGLWKMEVWRVGLGR